MNYERYYDSAGRQVTVECQRLGPLGSKTFTQKPFQRQCKCRCARKHLSLAFTSYLSHGKASEMEASCWSKGSTSLVQWSLCLLGPPLLKCVGPAWRRVSCLLSLPIVILGKLPILLQNPTISTVSGGGGGGEWDSTTLFPKMAKKNLLGKKKVTVKMKC